MAKQTKQPFAISKLRNIFIILNVLIAVAMLATGYAGHLKPTEWPLLALGGYVFPVFLAATVAFMLLWLFVKKRFVLISFVALVAAYGPATLYFPVVWGENTDETDENELKVMTYNTCNWGRKAMAPQTATTSRRCWTTCTTSMPT